MRVPLVMVSDAILRGPMMVNPQFDTFMEPFGIAAGLGMILPWVYRFCSPSKIHASNAVDVHDFVGCPVRIPAKHAPLSDGMAAVWCSKCYVHVKPAKHAPLSDGMAAGVTNFAIACLSTSTASSDAASVNRRAAAVHRDEPSSCDQSPRNWILHDIPVRMPHCIEVLAPVAYPVDFSVGPFTFFRDGCSLKRSLMVRLILGGPNPRTIKCTADSKAPENEWGQDSGCLRRTATRQVCREEAGHNLLNPAAGCVGQARHTRNEVADLFMIMHVKAMTYQFAQSSKAVLGDAGYASYQVSGYVFSFFHTRIVKYCGSQSAGSSSHSFIAFHDPVHAFQRMFGCIFRKL